MSNTMILNLPVKPETRDDFIEVLKGAVPDTRNYDGCQHLEIWTPEDNNGLVQIYEIWESKEHQEKYFAWRVETGLLDAIAEFLDGEPSVTWLDIHE